MSQDLSEKPLIESAIAGDVVALQQLLMHHYAALEQHIVARLPARARKHVGADDLLQIVFSQVFRDIQQFVPRSENSFFAWLRTIADNRLIDAIRKIDKGGAHQLSGANFEESSFVKNLIDEI